jgi:hypothetical protein
VKVGDRQIIYLDIIFHIPSDGDLGLVALKYLQDDFVEFKQDLQHDYLRIL